MRRAGARGWLEREKFPKYPFAGVGVPKVRVVSAEETIFPASPDVPGQAQSRRAYHELLASLESFAWWQDYRDLVGRGWDWRKAVYIAWRASPVQRRRPETQDELATTVLGLASDRVISKWLEKHPEMQDEVVRMQAAPLLQHRRDIYEALVAVARDPDPKAHSDRKLALEMLGDYRPRAQADVAVTNADAGVLIYLPDNGREDNADTD